MFALTTIISENPSSYEVHDGLFFKPPVELIDKQKIIKYISDRRAGWVRIDFGYHRFSLHDTEGTLYIFPGLYLTELPPNKNIDSTSHKFTKKEIELYGNKVLSFIDKTRQDTERDLNMLVHDLRNISSAIYNSAISASSALKRCETVVAQQEIDSVIASQAMLKMRTDVIDYIGNPTSIVEIKEIPIYRRVDKVCRAFNSRAFVHKVRINLTGQSYNITKEPDIL